jgi:transcriptional regulator
VGIEIAITRLEGKTKLSQNREARDRQSAAQTLIRHGHTQLGEAMQETIDPKA